MIIVQKHRILTQLDLDLVYGILPRMIQRPVRSMSSSNLPHHKVKAVTLVHHIRPSFEESGCMHWRI